ncbi:MAG: methyltransferase domain-containing protein [Candidatus Woesearchaeota archaeon]
MLRKLYSNYDVFMKFLGYDLQMGRFIQDLDLNGMKECRILDVGCGTGTLGLRLLKRFPGSKLISTDIQERFLHGITKKRRKEGISREKISTGILDVSRPEMIKFLDDTPSRLEEESFDIISIGGVIGYSKDHKKTLKRLLRLTRPGGYIIDLEMNNGPVGKYIARRYHYETPEADEMKRFIEKGGHEFSRVPIPAKYFPINLTREGMIIRKKG